MKIEDARKLPPSAQEEKRKLAIKFWEQGQSQKFIAKIVGVAPETMNRWVKRYKLEGASSLKAKKRGIKSGKYRHLTLDQESSLKKLVADKTSDQLKMSYVLWTRRAVMELVKQETGLPMPIRTVGEYLKRWGFTSQKPAKRAYEQNLKAAKRWLDEEYPNIASRAKIEKAEIYWGDETGIRNDSQHERGYSPKGKTPVVRLNSNRTSTNMISAITNQGKVRFKVFDGTMNADF
jgi:transposase